MIVLIEEDFEEYNLECGQIVDTSAEDSPITENQAQCLIIMKKATTDLDKYAIRNVKHVEGIKYSCQTCVIKNNAMYQLKPGIESSLTWVESEWDLILQGA